MQLQIPAELLSQLPGLVDPGWIGEGGGEAPLLPAALGRWQGGPQPQPSSGRRDLQADAGARIPQRPVDPARQGFLGTSRASLKSMPTLAQKELFCA